MKPISNESSLTKTKKEYPVPQQNLHTRETPSVPTKHAAIVKTSIDEIKVVKSPDFNTILDGENTLKKKVEVEEISMNDLEIDNNPENIKIVKQMLDELREEMHREMNTMHIEVIRQFQIQIVR